MHMTDLVALPFSITSFSVSDVKGGIFSEFFCTPQQSFNFLHCLLWISSIHFPLKFVVLSLLCRQFFPATVDDMLINVL